MKTFEVVCYYAGRVQFRRYFDTREEALQFIEGYSQLENDFPLFDHHYKSYLVLNVHCFRVFVKVIKSMNVSLRSEVLRLHFFLKRPALDLCLLLIVPP